MTPDLTPLLEAFAELVAENVVKRLRANEPDMVAQETSPLGRRRHCAAVQRRVAAGLPGAAIVGRKHLLTQAALGEELTKLGLAGKKSIADEAPSIADQLSAEIAEAHHSNTRKSVDKANGRRRGAPSSRTSNNRNGAQ